MKVKELVEKLNDLNITQTGDWEEDIPEGIWDEIFGDKLPKCIATVNSDTHRWYELATDVYEYNGEYFGVDGIQMIYSESMGWEDCCHTLKFYEMEEVPSVTYKIKK